LICLRFIPTTSSTKRSAKRGSPRQLFRHERSACKTLLGGTEYGIRPATGWLCGSRSEALSAPPKVSLPEEKLSVQVHPDDATAQHFGEPWGKTECWYVANAKPGAQIALGLKPGVDVTQLELAIREKRAEELLNWINIYPRRNDLRRRRNGPHHGRRRGPGRNPAAIRHDVSSL